MSWWETTIVVSAGILTLFNLIDKIIGYKHQAEEPTDKLEERVLLLEKKMEFEVKAIFVEYDARFGRDKQKIELLEQGNRITQKALRALLKHSIDGNNVAALEKAEEELSDYLLDK